MKDWLTSSGIKDATKTKIVDGGSEETVYKVSNKVTKKAKKAKVVVKDDKD